MPFDSKLFSVSAAAFGATYSITGPNNWDSPATTALAVSTIAHIFVSHGNLSQTLNDVNFRMAIFSVLAPALIYSVINGVRPDEIYYRIIFNSTIFTTLFPDVFRYFFHLDQEQNPAPAAGAQM